MEQYEILKTIGSGAQGSVYQVRHKQTNKIYVLKKMQCLNEKQANNALDEAKALMELRHPNICVYRDHFLKLDAERKTFDVCIIMDCYPDGDLQRILSLKRSSKTNLDEVLVKKWLAQLVHLLAYIHQKKFIHRDLKPTNIFVSASLDLVIGDFGVAAVDNEVRTHSNTVTGTPVWMAPEESAGRAYDSRCDVWSFGCILVEMLTCKHFSDAEMPERLLALSSNLEPVLTLISKDYSKSMADFVRILLEVDPSRRPYSRELKNIPLVKECLKLIPGASHEVLQGSESCDLCYSLPTDGGPAAVLAFLQQKRGVEAAAATALDWLAERADFKLDNAAERAIAEALRAHLSSEAVCAPAAAIFAAATARVRKSSTLHTSAVVKPMLEAAANHPSSLAVQSAVASYQANVSEYEGGPRLLAAYNGIALLIAALGAFPVDARLAEAASRALFGLFSEAENARVGAESGALEALSRCWVTHKSRPEVLAAVSSALLGLSGEAAILEVAEKFGLVSRLSCGLAEFPEHRPFVRFALQLLASLMEDEKLAIAFVTIKNAPEGIPQLTRVFSKHRSAVEVLEPMSYILENITSHKPNLTQKQATEIKNLAQNIAKQLASKQEVKNACDQVLASLANY